MKAGPREKVGLPLILRNPVRKHLGKAKSVQTVRLVAEHERRLPLDVKAIGAANEDKEAGRTSFQKLTRPATVKEIEENLLSVDQNLEKRQQRNVGETLRIKAHERHRDPGGSVRLKVSFQNLWNLTAKFKGHADLSKSTLLIRAGYLQGPGAMRSSTPALCSLI